MKECAEFMRRLLTIDNILSIFSLCKTIGCHEIDYHLLNFIDVGLELDFKQIFSIVDEFRSTFFHISISRFVG